MSRSTRVFACISLCVSKRVYASTSLIVQTIVYTKSIEVIRMNY